MLESTHYSLNLQGYGILGHAKLLAKRQKKKVNFVIHNLPVLAKMNTIAKAMGNSFGLAKGVAPEISGGMLIALPREEVGNNKSSWLELMCQIKARAVND